jgi:hypothetical protein
MHNHIPNLLSRWTSDLFFFLEMENPQCPVQALVRQPRLTFEDEEQAQPVKFLLGSQQRPHPQSSAKLMQRYYTFFQYLEHLGNRIPRTPKQSLPSPLPSYHPPLNCEPFQLEDLIPKSRNRKLQPANLLHASGSSRERAGGSGTKDESTGIRNRRPRTTARVLTGEWQDKKKVKQGRREDEILDILGPMLADETEQSASILLCWGKQDQCQVVPVKIPHSADALAQWHEIRRMWYAQRGMWRKYMPMYGVKEVSVVDVSCLRSDK